MEIPRFQVDEVVATVIAPEFAAEVVDYFERNRGRYGPVGDETPDGFFTQSYWQSRLQKAQDELDAGTSLRMFLRYGQSVVGHVNYTAFAGFPFHKCSLGFSLDAEHEGRGLLTRLLPQSNRWVFDQRNVHRIEAFYMPTNERSAALLQRLDFNVEGTMRAYVHLHGAWEDHVMAALINEDWQ